MKYSEFREYLTLNQIPFREDEEKLKVTYHVEISKIEEHSIMFVTDVINFPYEFDLIKKVIELAETPLEGRREVKKYYLKHRFINELTAQKYININIFGEVTIRDHLESGFFKTKFTKAEIEELKEKFNTDLRDFEIIEVKED